MGLSFLRCVCLSCWPVRSRCRSRRERGPGLNSCEPGTPRSCVYNTPVWSRFRVNLTRISILALARPQYTPALPRIPRLFSLNPANHLRRWAPGLVSPLTDVDRAGSTARRPAALHAKPFWRRKLLILVRATLPARQRQRPGPVRHLAERPPVFIKLGPLLPRRCHPAPRRPLVAVTLHPPQDSRERLA